MEEKINIAAILKDKPQGTKLHDWLHNIDVELDTISTTDTETVVVLSAILLYFQRLKHHQMKDTLTFGIGKYS